MCAQLLIKISILSGNKSLYIFLWNKVGSNQSIEVKKKVMSCKNKPTDE